MLTAEEALQDEGIKGLLNSYIQYWESGGLGKTAELWMAYMRHVCLMLTLLEAVKTNNFLLLQHYIYSDSKRYVNKTHNNQKEVKNRRYIRAKAPN